MGLFSSKKITTVGTTVSRVIGESDLPNSLKTGLINSIFQEDDLTDLVLEEVIGSIAFKADRAYKYAASTYSYGLPSGKVVNSSRGLEEVTTILEELEGTVVLGELVPAAVSVIYSKFGPANQIHLSWMALIKDYGYNPATNELVTLSAIKNTPVYLHDIHIAMPSSIYSETDISELEVWGPAPSSGYTPQKSALSEQVRLLIKPSLIIVDDSISEEEVRFTYAWAITTDTTSVSNEYQETSLTEYFTETIKLNIQETNEEADYYHIKYLVNGITKFIIYEYESGGYPVLDEIIEDTEDTFGEYFPFLYFRFNKKSMNGLKGTPEYATSKKLAKYFGMDYEDTVAAIHKNPDIGDVEQAMMIMGVQANSQDKEDLRYLFEYFKAQSLLQNPEEYSMKNLQFYKFNNQDVGKNATIIKDARFKLSFSNDGIATKLVFGNLGKIGSHHSEIKTLYEPHTYIDIEGGIVETTLPYTVHYYRKQLSANIYEEVTVRSLRMKYHIYGKYTTTGEETDPILLVPLDRVITQKYSLSDRENLYSSSMHYVFNSRIVTKIKWYQSTFFTFLITVAAIAIGGYFLAPQLAPLMAGLAAGTITLQALAMTMAMKLVESLVMQEVIKIFVKAIGLENAFMVAIISVVALAGFAAMNGGFSKMPWGDTLLKATTGLISGTNKAFAGAMQELQVEFEKFGLYVQEQNDLLKEQMDLLKGNNLLNPFIVFGESPNDFYNRTVHSGNIGVIGIHAVKHYVPNALTLPKLTETLGDNPHDATL